MKQVKEFARLNRKNHNNSASFEALSGLSSNVIKSIIKTDEAKLIAFYLPQYHRIYENSLWWGPGFTEWTNVVKASPNYNGHYQPHLPRELGFYDLSNIEIMREQAEMAQLYGINAFCFYYYWFSGQRILEKPIENFLQSDIDIKYCLCWANENWTRTWDGDVNGVLLEQKYLSTDPQLFINSLLPHFDDNRYITVDQKPLLLVYRAKDIPNTKDVFDIWRESVVKSGLPGLYIVVVDFYDISRPDEVGADAMVEFPPHKFNGPENAIDKLPGLVNSDFTGAIVDYKKLVAQSCRRSKPDFTLYRTVLPSWDNTARRQNTPLIVHGSSPDLFRSWLRYIRAYTREFFTHRSDHFIFINAWNEWGEGCHLEPDQKWGLSYLESVKLSSFYKPEVDTLESVKSQLLSQVMIPDNCLDDVTSVKTTVPSKLKANYEPENQKTNRVVRWIVLRLRSFPLTYKVVRAFYRWYNSKLLKNI